jgi:hypothetical protein
MTKDSPQSDGAEDARKWKPVLGLTDEPGEPKELTVRAGTVYDQPEPGELLELTVIVPARNEADCIGACLESLVRQSEDVFELGRDWELIVVDDESTDRTAEIVRSFAGVTVIKAAELEEDLDGCAKGAGTLAAVYRCGYGARAGGSAPGHS